jgi:hypothetical protein
MVGAIVGDRPFAASVAIAVLLAVALVTLALALAGNHGIAGVRNFAYFR